MATRRLSKLETASWIAGICGAVVALVAYLWPPATSDAKPPMSMQQAGHGNTQIGTMSGGTVYTAPPAPQTSVSGEFPVPKIYGLTYDEARKLLIQEGWVPAKNRMIHGDSVEASSGNGPEFWKRGYWELDSCSGTGLGHCMFRFIDPSRRVMVVVTEGEESEDNTYHARVHSFSLEPRATK